MSMGLALTSVAKPLTDKFSIFNIVKMHTNLTKHCLKFIFCLNFEIFNTLLLELATTGIYRFGGKGDQ